jgi:outer membrane protein OmpA-like peptidoglycan-associated protein
VAAVVELPVKIYFEVGKRDLPLDASRQLAAVAEVALANPDRMIDISGYTDASGDPVKNEELAKERAKAVRDALTAEGVPLERINMKKPEVITGSGTEAEARRVEVSMAG